MKPKISVIYKVSLCKTRFLLNKDGTSKMEAPVVNFVGDSFGSEESAMNYLKQKVVEEVHIRSQYNGASVHTYSGRMFSVQVKNVVALFTYGVVPIPIGLL